MRHPLSPACFSSRRYQMVFGRLPSDTVEFSLSEVGRCLGICVSYGLYCMYVIVPRANVYCLVSLGVGRCRGAQCEIPLKISALSSSAIRAGRGGARGPGGGGGGAGSMQRNTIYGHENSRIVPYRCYWSSQAEAG